MQTLDELLQQGWAEHDAKTAEVADRLEAHVSLVTDGDGAARFMALANHAVGDHGKDRARALRLCRAAVAQAGDEPGVAALVQLAVACELVGEADAASEARQRVGDDAALGARIGLLVAQGHMHAGNWKVAGPLYLESLAAVEALAPGHAAERAAAVVSNNMAAELLDLTDRSDEHASWMERAALAAHTFWTRVGNWVNHERADYLLASVHTALNKAADGRAFAERGLATIAANGEEKVDEAFLHLARARACKALGDGAAHTESLARADALAAEFDDGLKSWFAGERAKAE